MAQWRAKEWQPTGSQSGTVASKGAKQAGSSPTKPLSTNTSATEGTEAEKQEVLTDNQNSSLLAGNTPINSSSNMVWMLSPLQVTEQPWILSECKEEIPLKPETLILLKNMALASNTPVPDLIHQICLYYVEAESEIAEIGTVVDALEFYFANEVL